MTTLRIAIAQSPIRSASAQTPCGVIEVRGLMTDRHVGATAASSQQTWTGAMRYELLTCGTPQVVGSFSDIVEFTSYLRAAGRELDWQPVAERVQPTQHAKGVH